MLSPAAAYANAYTLEDTTPPIPHRAFDGKQSENAMNLTRENMGNKMMNTLIANATQGFTDPGTTPMSTPLERGVFDPLGASKVPVASQKPKASDEQSVSSAAAIVQPTFAEVERGVHVGKDPLVSSVVQGELADVKPPKRFVNYESLHGFVLDTISPKSKTISKYNFASISKPLNPDPLGMAPYGVRVHSHQFVDSAFDPTTATMPKFLVAVVGSFPTLGREFHKNIYSQWKEVRKTVSDICDEHLTDDEGIRFRSKLDKVVETRAQVARKFISAALALYKGNDAKKLPQVVGPWIRPFFSEIDDAITEFKNSLEAMRALADEAPVHEEEAADA